MKNMEYRSNYNRNYLKFDIEESGDARLRYQYQILLNRKLEGFLPASLRKSDGQSSLYYEISSRQSLAKWFMKKKVDRDWIRRFIEDMKVALWSMEQYLLDERNLVLRPDTVFQDMESGRMLFLYYPYCIEEEPNGMGEFLTLLLEHVDSGEPDVVEAIYSIYAQWESLQDFFTLELLLFLMERFLQEECEERKEEEIRTEARVIEDVEESEPEEGKKRWDLKEWFFNPYRRIKDRLPYAAMERLEYNAGEDTPDSGEDAGGAAGPAPGLESMGKTVYMTVNLQEEERKLYGNGRENRKVISLDKLPIVVGKKDGMTDVVLTDSSVSRMHARFSEEDGHVCLEDLNATNGTYKNGVRLKPYEKVELLKEDEVKLGNLSFTYR